MIRRTMILLAAALAAAPAAAAAPDPTAYAASPEVRQAITQMAESIKPSEEMLYRPLLGQAPYTVALEYWVRPKQAASHLTEAELIYVLDGAGTLISGGTLANAHHWYGETNGGDVVGGTTRKLKSGDIALVPAGTPHWFGISGTKLVLLTMHMPVQKEGAQ